MGYSIKRKTWKASFLPRKAIFLQGFQDARGTRRVTRAPLPGPDHSSRRPCMLCNWACTAPKPAAESVAAARFRGEILIAPKRLNKLRKRALVDPICSDQATGDTQRGKLCPIKSFARHPRRTPIFPFPAAGPSTSADRSQACRGAPAPPPIQNANYAIAQERGQQFGKNRHVDFFKEHILSVHAEMNLS